LHFGTVDLYDCPKRGQLRRGFETQPGQSMSIIGSCPELGEWDHPRAYGMEYVNANTWIATIAFNPDESKVINYKFVVNQESGEPIVEYLINRKMLLPAEGRIAVDCFWNSPN
jgi:cyclomaltodextrin glucanotransferase